MYCKNAKNFLIPVIDLTILMLLRHLIGVRFSLSTSLNSSYFCGMFFFVHIKIMTIEVRIEHAYILQHVYDAVAPNVLKFTHRRQQKKNKGPTMVSFFFLLSFAYIQFIENKLLIVTANWNEFCKYRFVPMHISITKIIFGIVFTYPNNNYIWIFVLLCFFMHELI